MNPELDIDIHFDLICPWCLIGKRNLTHALQQLQAMRPDLRPRMTWHSFPLLPDTPLNGLPYQEFYERRLGGPAAVAARRAQVREAGRLAGVEFAFDQIAVMPNTLAAHGLVGLIANAGDETATERLIEALFQGYFVDSRDIGDLAVLIEIAGECGIAVSREQLASARPEADSLHAKYAVSGVPYYVFNNRLALSGAHPPEALVQAMLRSID